MSDSQGVDGEAAVLLAEPDSDIGLLRRVVAKDSDAFDVLYARHVRTVYRAALARVGSVPDAEEITQETFVTLWRRAASVRIADSLLPWLLVTARGLAGTATEPPSASQDQRQQHRLDEAVAQAVSDLSEKDKTLYRLCTDGGMDYRTAARRTLKPSTKGGRA